jgi:MATE family multidrug resistance protein
MPRNRSSDAPSGRATRPAFDRGLKLTALWSFGLAGVISAFFLIAGPWLISALTTSPEVRQAALTYMPWAAITGLTGALAFVMDGVFIGATWSSDMRNRMLMSFAGYLAAVAIFVPLYGNHGLWLAMNGFLLFRGVFLAVLVARRADQTFRAAQ